MDVRSEVLKKIKPTPQEEERVKGFVNQLQTVARTVSGLDTVIVGSIGKFTWLAGDHDVDIFLLFEQTVPREELERLGMEYGKRIVGELGGKCKIKYAEHPYVHALVRGFDVDVVPCYRVKYGEKIKSAVDRSPMHLQYILGAMKPAMADEARLLKQFCKGIGVYGSDAKHQGFSGYICELLVLNYGTFEKVVEAASAWRAPFVINIERHLGLSMGKFRDHPLVIIDPVDPDRNVAAVVSSENFVKFISNCRKFGRQPGVGFFFPRPRKPLTAGQLKILERRRTNFIAIEFRRPDVIDDVLYPQLRRALSRLHHMLEHNEFRVLRSMEFAGRDPVMVFELETWEQPAVRAMVGPPIFEEKHSREFLSKYANNFVRLHENKWVADVPRRHQTAESLLNDFFRNTPQAMVEHGLPGHIAAAVAKKKIIQGKDFWRLVRRDKQLSAHLAEKYFVDHSNDLLTE